MQMQRIKEECNFLKIVSNVQCVLNLWRYRNLTLEGRIVVFKSLAISKIVFQALIAPVPTHVIKALETIQTSFLWNNSNPKIKHKTLCKRYENGGLKNVDIRNKVNSLQSSWVKRLYDDCLHERKIIPLYQLNKTFGPSFKFHSNLSFKKSSLKKLLPFCRHMLNRWSQSLSGSPETFSQIPSQFLWFNKYIQIEGTVIHFPKFSNKGINFLSQLFENGRIISWINLKDRYELTNNMFFQWAQLKYAIPPRWKKIIFDYNDINENDLCQNHHVIKGARILPLDKLSSKEIYSILISNIVNKPTLNIHFEKLFQNTTLDWNKIYLSPLLATIDTTLRSFQYKILNNVFFLNKKLYTYNYRNNKYCFLLFL